MAEDNTQGTGTDSTVDNEANNQADDKSKVFTQEQVNKIAGERASQERKKAQEEFDSKAKKIAEDAAAEATRQAKLTSDQREKEQSEKSRKELEDRERSITIRENRSTGIEILAASKVPTKFIEYLVDTDPKVMGEKISTFTSEWNEAVKAEVAEQIKGGSRKDVNGGSSNATIGDDERKSF